MKSHKNDDNTTRIAVLETLAYQTNETLKRLEYKIDSLDQKLDTKINALDKKFDTKIDALDKKFDLKIDDLRKEMRSQFFWIMTTILMLFASPFVVDIIKLFKGN